jgi:sulfur transfer complex TusBCD TusB component (DsrH family)
MYLRYQPDIAELQLSRIQTSSAQTYKTGANHFKTFLVQQGVTMLDLLNSSPTDLHNVASCFVTYLSFLTARNTTTPIDSKVINGYLTHVVHLLINNGVIDSADQFRCPSTSRLVAAIMRRDSAVRRPLRETISIALSLPIVQSCIDTAVMEFSDPVLVAFITAALYIGYIFSLRPDDFLVPVANDKHRVRGCQVHAWFPGHDQPYSISQLHPPYIFPPSGTRPNRFSLLADYDKANVTGDASMRACGANPIPGQFCFIHWLYEFFLLFPVLDDRTAIFGSIPADINTSPTFLYDCFRRTLKLSALKLGLRVSQLLPRGARGAASAQIKGSGGSQQDCKLSGGWHSRAFEKYQRSDFAMSDRCAAAMHNIDAVDVNVVRYVHSTPRPPPL